MSSPSEPAVQPAEKKFPTPVPGPAERRADIEAKQAQVAALLAEVECEALILLEPESFAWITSGTAPRNVLDPMQAPAMYVSPDVRSVLASNLDSQRLFDEELDGLGFQLKEWHWSWGREQLLAYMCRGRRFACDVGRADCKLVADQLHRLRMTISDYDLTNYQRLGLLLSHALEATCRTLKPKEPEQEVAGHFAHRLMKHGPEPVSVEVTADDRLRLYRRPTYTPAVVNKHCVITATARMAGLYATASRAVCFGEPDPNFRKEHDAACKVTTSYISSSWPDAIPSALLQAGRRVFQINGYENEWRLSPAGFITGRTAIEQFMTPQMQENLRAGWAITWRANIGAACSCDTVVVTSKGPVVVTAAGNWPKKRIKIGAAYHDRPDILQR
jgi:Xaa-Pro aminopeptidase